MSKKFKLKWRDEPEKQDYPAAESYLNLFFDPRKASVCVGKLRRAAKTEFKAKDIFRASGLSLLGVSNLHVARDQKKIHAGEKLSPILLVRDQAKGRVIVADGYHRMCAVYTFDEDAVIPCKIV